jgi:iron complex transport system substrate-binding protein
LTRLAARRPAPFAAAVKPSRRVFLFGAGSLLLLGAAGCGSSAGGGEEGATGRTIEHKYGATKISGAPERIVTVGFSDQDFVLALGAKPVAVTDWYGDYPHAVWPWAQDELGNAEPEVLNRGKFTGATEPNFEAIAALEPDLVIAMYSGLSEKQYETLSEIAPTAAQSGEYPDYGMPWQVTTRFAGLALGKRERAEELISGIEGSFEEAREKHPEFEGKTAVVAERFDTGFFVRSPQDPRSQFLTSLGFDIPEEIAELTGDKDGADVSEERMDLLDRDVLVWNAGFTPDLPADLEGNPLYQKLDVAREGRALFVVDEVLSGALTWSTVLSLPFALDGIVPMLAKATNGDPCTEVTSSS